MNIRVNKNVVEQRCKIIPFIIVAPAALLGYLLARDVPSMNQVGVKEFQNDSASKGRNKSCSSLYQSAPDIDLREAKACSPAGASKASVTE